MNWRMIYNWSRVEEMTVSGLLVRQTITRGASPFSSASCSTPSSRQTLTLTGPRSIERERVSSVPGFVTTLTLTVSRRLDLKEVGRVVLTARCLGSAVPFGRSLTYRFACGAFFAALAVAEVDDLPQPLSQPGAVRGYLSRHMRWWANHSSDVFYSDGTLSIGWLYPDLHMAEDYNSPQSPYWCMKTLIALGLGPEHPFWRTEEAAFPQILRVRDSVVLLPLPGHIICNQPAGNHHFLLSTRQFIAWPLRANKAKYSKFAYSSAFGFSVPVGEHLSQLAPDSTLALSRDGGETWAVKWKWAREPTFSTAKVWSNSDRGRRTLGDVPISAVKWWPWGDRSIEVETILIPPTSRWPDWHVRVHTVKRNPQGVPGIASALQLVEGGFAIYGRYSKTGRHLGRLDTELDQARLGTTEGYLATERSALILSSAGASGILSQKASSSDLSVPPSCRTSALRPSPNTNLVCPRTVIPVTQIDAKGLEQSGRGRIFMVTCVFAISTEANGGAVPEQGRTLEEKWLDVPQITFSGSEKKTDGGHGDLDVIVIPGNPGT
jgi:hypothetical protein